jgi:hypothetical protein
LTQDLQSAFEEKLQGLLVAMIEERDTELARNASVLLCGGKLHADLAVSEEELNLAGRALAFGLSTASVSHAMRSAEAALQVLAKAVGITFSAPVELHAWANLTQKLKSELDKWELKPKSQQKAERLKWLSELLLPADCFRLAWRNHVAHAREKYEEAEARSVLVNVGTYLKTLSNGL